MSHQRSNMRDIFDVRSDWIRLGTEDLKDEGIHESKAIYWNNAENIAAWVIARSEPTNPRFEGSFFIDSRTLQFMCRAQVRDYITRGYVVLIEDWTSHHIHARDTCHNVKRLLQEVVPTNTEFGNCWMVNEEFAIKSIRPKRMSQRAPFLGKGLLDEDC